jgi:GDP-L-fucose synthase
VHEAKVTGASEIEVWGPGTARREFTYVEDLASWVAASVGEVANLPGVLNLGIGMDYSVDEFYLVAMEAIEFQAQLVHDLSKPEGMKVKLMDSSMARHNSGWDPQTDLVAGLRKTYKWFLESQDKGARL